ncbi:MAG: glycosyltransferase family 4 protein [Methanobacteriaceae archaeon]
MVVDDRDRSQKSRILFVHHTAMWYRKPFFKALSQLYPVEFLFTNVEGYNQTYDTQLSQKIPGMQGVNYRVVPKQLGVAWGAIKRVMGDYDVFVGGSWDTASDLVETIFYFIIVKLKNKPFILWREDWDWKVHSLKRRLVKVFAGFFGRHADAVLVPGSKHGEFFSKLGVSADKIFIMPNVSNIALKDDDYIYRDIIVRENELKDKKIVLFVGRLIDLKGVQYLLPAFAKLRQLMDNVELYILGDGECREKLENISKDLELDNWVHFMGNIDHNLLGAYYLLCNVFVLPSITTYYADACPLVVNEAMYFGKPVVTSDAVGTTFMIKDGLNGYVVEERNSQALAEALYHILSNDVLEKKMGETSKKIIEEGFTYQNMMEGFHQALEYIKEKRS